MSEKSPKAIDLYKEEEEIPESTGDMIIQGCTTPAPSNTTHVPPHQHHQILANEPAENLGEPSKTMQENVKMEHKIDVDAEMIRWERRSIYKLPGWVTNLDNNAYQPQVVSFGPYHYGDARWNHMAKHKERALLHFLQRSGKPLESYIDSLGEIVDDLMDAYDELHPYWHENKDEFLKLMVWDGCFILEILRTSIQSMRDYARNDPIFSDHGKIYIMPYIRRDMLKIENQIPMSVLEKLLEVEGVESQDNLEFVINWLIFQLYHRGTKMEPQGKSLHVLDVFRKSLLQPPFLLQAETQNQPKGMVYNEQIIRSATEIAQAGIRFRTSCTTSLKDITFDEEGILRLPQLVVDDVTETMFLNLIAFERFHVGAGNDVTAYVFFMDGIINKSRDVDILRSCGVIQNGLGSDKAVADLFNSLSKHGLLDPENSLSMVHNRVAEYWKKPWSIISRWHAMIERDYFNEPWAIFKVGGVIVLALTATETAYSILDYYKS